MICKCCKKEYVPDTSDRRERQLMHYGALLDTDFFDDYHRQCCEKCIDDEIRYCTTDNEYPDPLSKGIRPTW